MIRVGGKGRALTFGEQGQKGNSVYSVRKEFACVPLYLNHNYEDGTVGQAFIFPNDDGTGIDTVFSLDYPVDDYSSISVGYTVRPQDMLEMGDGRREDKFVNVYEVSLVNSPNFLNSKITEKNSDGEHTYFI